MPALDRQKVLSTPEVSVGGTKISITPNSLTTTVPGDVAVRSQSSGGTSFEVVAGLDAETLISEVSWSMANTASNVELVRGWKQQSRLGVPTTITVSETTGQYPFSEMFLTNSPELGFEAEGDIELEWAGRAEF